MTKLEKVALSLNETIDILKIIADDKGMPMSIITQTSPTQISFQTGEAPALVRIWVTAKNGLTIDGSAGKNRYTSEIILEDFSKISNFGRVKGGNASYIISESMIKVIYEKIKNISYYRVTDLGPTSNIIYRLEVLHGTRNEKVVVTQYGSGTMLLQGLTWEVWDNLCNLVEAELNAPVVNVVCRFVADSKQEQEIVNIVTAEIENSAEQLLQTRLGSVFPFLWEHDRKCLISSQCLVQSRLVLPEYFSFVAPSAKALEGYLKKSLVHNGIVSESDLSQNPNIFAEEFLGNRTTPSQCSVKQGSRLANYLNTITDAAIKAQKENGFIKIYKAVRMYRHPYLHTGPPGYVHTVPDYETAVNLIDNIIGVMSSGHLEIN